MYYVENIKIKYIRDSIAGFKFGNTVISSLLQAFVTCEITGKNLSAIGHGQAGLCPPWNDKSAQRSTIPVPDKEQEMQKIAGFTLNLYNDSRFSNPLELFDTHIDAVKEYAQSVNRKLPVPGLLIMNAIAAIDLALWDAYARIQNRNVFEVLPEEYKRCFTGNHEKVIVLHTVGGTDSLGSIGEAIRRERICALKIKLNDDVTWNIFRVKEIHGRFGSEECGASVFGDGKMAYSFDLNEQCRNKDDLLRFISFLETSGIMDRTILIEEPFYRDDYSSDVRDSGIDIMADERLVYNEDVRKIADLGYKRIAVKPTARTFSESLKMVKSAQELGMISGVMDLTNGVPYAFPVGVLTAAKLPAVPGERPFLETNGRQYYSWDSLIEERVEAEGKNLFYTMDSCVQLEKLLHLSGFGI